MHDIPEISFKTHVYRLPHLLGMHYIEIPKPIIDELGGNLKIRLLCTVNETLTFRGGMVALGGGDAYISLNVQRMKKLRVKEGDEVLLTLKKDTSKYGMELSPELAEVLRQDEEGMQRFEGLTPGKQRYIIYYVSQVKNSQLRIDRALMLITNLKKTPKGKESFRDILGIED